MYDQSVNPSQPSLCSSTFPATVLFLFFTHWNPIKRKLEHPCVVAMFRDLQTTLQKKQEKLIVENKGNFYRTKNSSMHKS